MKSAPGWMIEAAARRRRRPDRAGGSWITDPTAPIPFSADDAVSSFARRLNRPYHDQIARPLGRIGEVEMDTGAGTG